MRKLDALVAEKVMGCKIIHTQTVRGLEPYRCDCAPNFPHNAKSEDGSWLAEYSTDIAAAWDVLDHLKTKDIWPSVFALNNGWMVELKDNGTYFQTMRAYSTGETAPLAICLAALKAVGVSEEEIKEAMGAK